MAEITVSLVQGGAVVDTIKRPLRFVNGGPAVTYRKTLWPVVDGMVYLDGAPPTNGAVRAASATTGTPAEDVGSDVVPEPPPTLESGWDDSQRAVIKAPRSARLLVDAGPGTGKTAVACARLAWLISTGAIEPVNCLIISFTNTAVHELRSRIGSYLQDPSMASAIKIATLDSYAWSLQAGFDSEATLTGSYDDGVARALSTIMENPAAGEYLERAEHVIVDEAQDIIGVRVDFVLGLIERLHSDCGVTVFADEAQAIYGFSEDAPTQGRPHLADPLPLRLRRLDTFANTALDTVHRTASPTLKEIFTTVRGMVISGDAAGQGPGNEVRAAIERLSRMEGLQAWSLDISKLSNNTLVLFRRRAEALMASSMLRAVPHRLRMGGLPSCLHAWIGVCFFDVVASRLTRLEFEDRWKSRVENKLPVSESSTWAWEQLLSLAGTNPETIDTRVLRRKLARRSAPPSLAWPDIGSSGPILGTIHGSKGREADTVLLMMPSENSGGDPGEETRIIFVGATRARSQLRTGAGFHNKSANLPSRRVYGFPRGGKAQHALMVEVGRDGDIWPGGLAGRDFFSPDQAAWAQARCQELAATPRAARADRLPGRTSRFYGVIADDDEAPCAILSSKVHDDLWELAKIAGTDAENLIPPRRLGHLRLVGARTVAVSAEEAEALRLNEPWASSGFMLAPIVLCYTKAKFWARR